MPNKWHLLLSKWHLLLSKRHLLFSKRHLSKTRKPESSQSPASLHSFPILKQLLTN